MIVDDEPQGSSLLESCLTKVGFNTAAAANGEEALEKVRNEKPAIVLLDVTLPGMNGLMALKRIKEIDGQIGVIMIMGKEDESIGEEAIKLGAYGYILKPMDLD